MGISHNIEHMLTMLGRRPFSWLKAMGLGILYLFVYVLLDAVSYLHDFQHTEITPWNPNIAWTVVVVMYFGLRAAPLTIVAPSISEFILRSASPAGIPVIAAAVCIGCTYTMAGLLLQRIQRNFSVPTIGWLVMLSAVLAGSALVEAALYSAALIWSGNIRLDAYFEAVRTDWVGAINGIVTLLPMIIILRSGEGAKVREVRSHLVLVSAQTVALVLAFVITFWDSWSATNGVKQTPFDVLFLPIIWIALRWGAGVTAIALGLLQLGIVIFVAKYHTPESFLTIQLLMVLLAATGLFLGISVSENARFSAIMRSKDDDLSHLNARVSMSEMNSAIGHELNTPLGALANYIQSAKLIMNSPKLDGNLLKDVLDKALGETSRCVRVVSELREFFRFGVAQRHSLDPRRVVAEALATLQNKPQQAGITFVSEIPPSVQNIFADPLQLSMALQNILSNACDATCKEGSRRRRIVVKVTSSSNEVEFRVEDSGLGIPEMSRNLLFRPMPSTKTAGMGFGLAISRSLIEANGGRIRLVSSGASGTIIAFTVPVDDGTAERASA